MTKEFMDWFDKNAPAHLFPDEEERENLQVMCWLAWRDGIRSVSKVEKCEKYYLTTNEVSIR